MPILRFLLLVFASLLSSTANAADFNGYVIETMRFLHDTRGGGGYDLQSYFTQDLKYGDNCCTAHDNCCVKANHPHKSMCVAAVAEVIIEAINRYAERTEDRSVYTKLPARSWTHGTIRDIRAWIFEYSETPSQGAAHAIEVFGLGKRLKFTELKPGDLIKIDRTDGTGHSMFFLGYLDRSAKLLDQYDEQKVAGFKYFSAQGRSRPESGFGYMYGFFDGFCPSDQEMEDPKDGKLGRDCKIKRSSAVGGRIFAPAEWTTEASLKKIEADAIVGLYEQSLGRVMTKRERSLVRRPVNIELMRKLLEKELDRELTPSDLSRYTDMN